MKVLIVRLSAIGDVVHTLPALELLRASLPGGELTWVVEAAAAPLLEDHPALDRVVVVDRRGLLRARGRPGALRRTVRALAGLRRERFDLAIDFQGLLRSALVARASGAEVCGPAWAREGARFLYRRRLDVPRPPEAHAVERARHIARQALLAHGVTPRAPQVELRLPEALQGAPPPDPYVVLLPGAGKPTNRLPPAAWAEVADLLAAERPDLELVVAGGAQDRARGAEVAARAQRARVRSTCGALDLAGSARLLAGAALVVGGDTGPLHLARALGRPVLGLFPAASPFRTGPAGLPGTAPVGVIGGEVPCAPCCASRCRRPGRDRICLAALTPRRIADAGLALVPGAGSPR